MQVSQHEWHLVGKQTYSGQEAVSLWARTRLCQEATSTLLSCDLVNDCFPLFLFSDWLSCCRDFAICSRIGSFAFFLGHCEHCVNAFGLSNLPTSIGAGLNSPCAVDITEEEQLQATGTAATVSWISPSCAGWMWDEVLGRHHRREWG